jgi:hypothetical protein
VDALGRDTWFVLFHATAHSLKLDFLLGKQLSKKSEEDVQARLKPLLALVKRMESNTQLDMQEGIFKISDKVTDLR